MHEPALDDAQVFAHHVDRLRAVAAGLAGPSAAAVVLAALVVSGAVWAGARGGGDDRAARTGPGAPTTTTGPPPGPEEVLDRTLAQEFAGGTVWTGHDAEGATCEVFVPAVPALTFFFTRVEGEPTSVVGLVPEDVVAVRAGGEELTVHHRTWALFTESVPATVTYVLADGTTRDVGVP